MNKEKMMKGKGIINGLLWFVGIVVFVQFMYEDVSIVSFILGMFFLLSIAWFVLSMVQLFYGVKFYLSSQKWNYFTYKEWIVYLASLPLLISSFLLYVNYLK